MEVISLCPLRVASIVWQPRPGAFSLTVVCKATYVLAPVESKLDTEHEAPFEADAYWNDDEARSLREASDLVPFKQRADVIVVGSVYAPRQQLVASITARVVVREIDKAIDVYGDRAWQQDGSLREGPRFQKMPLQWERAGGGPDTANPVGVRADGPPDRFGMVPLPNLQPVGQKAQSRGEYIDPIGFGPIAPTWPLRANKLYRAAATFSHRAWHERPMPEIDPGYFNAAPADQQLETLHSNERIMLLNLHPTEPRLVTSLQGVAPRGRVERRAGVADLALRCDTLTIDTDRGRAHLVWRGQVPLERPDEPGRISITLDAVAPSSQPATEPAGQPRKRVQTLDTATVTAARATVMPFARSSVQQPRQEPATAWSGTPFAPGSVAPPAPTSSTAPVLPVPAPGAPPFVPVPAAAPAAPAFVPAPAKSTPGFVSAPVPAPVPAPPAPAFAPAPVSLPGPSFAASPAPFVAAPGVPAPSFATPAPVPAPAPVDAGLSIGQMAAQQPSVNEAAPRPAPTVSPSASTQTAQSRAIGRAPRDIVDLLWFDPESAPRVRTVPAWKALLEELTPKEAPAKDDFDFDDEPPAKKASPEISEKREIQVVIARAEAVDADGMNDAISAAVADDGWFDPPLVLMSGELSFPFDEIESLKAILTAAAPLAPNDKKLKDTIDAANEAMKTPVLQSSTSAAESLSTRVKEAFAQANRTLPANYLDTQTERMLLEQRHYQKRTIFGEPRLRALLTPAGSTVPIPVYLPEALGKQLPLFQRFRARVLVDVHMQQDQYETHACALKAVAVGRVLPVPGRR
jgi:hypothetical protein